MTTDDFREGVDRLGVAWDDLASRTGRSARAVKSYYYGERDVPNDVAVIVTQLLHEAEKAGLRVVEPWWIDTMDRFATIASSNVRAERDQLRGAVASFCRGCEPEGICRTADCQLRPVSPLPLITLRRARTA